jgi:hypothetical protein
MKSIKLSIWASLFVTLILEGCGAGKYDDGPLVSFYSDKNRITKEWTLKKFSINGADSTNKYKCTSCPFFLKFAKSNVAMANYMVNGQLQTVSNGTWNFEDHDKKVNLLTAEIVEGPIMNSGSWDITRSSKKQLWLSHMSGGKLYEIELE